MVDYTLSDLILLSQKAQYCQFALLQHNLYRKWLMSAESQWDGGFDPMAMAAMFYMDAFMVNLSELFRYFHVVKKDKEVFKHLQSTTDDQLKLREVRSRTIHLSSFDEMARTVGGFWENTSIDWGLELNGVIKYIVELHNKNNPGTAEHFKEQLAQLSQPLLEEIFKLCKNKAELNEYIKLFNA